jgi:hypothetical protein
MYFARTGPCVKPPGAGFLTKDKRSRIYRTILGSIRSEHKIKSEDKSTHHLQKKGKIMP